MRLRVAAPLLSTVAVFLMGCGASPTADPSVPPERANSVQADLEAMVGSGAVGALATLGEGNAETVLTAGVSELTDRAPIPADPAQHVRVASITKTFTAALIMQLVAENRVDLDHSIDTYLPGLLTGDGVDGRAVTVRQILSHRSGLPEVSGPPDELPYRAAREGRAYTPDQEIDIALRHPAQFAPGTGYKYTNTNFIVAGMLIEAVTGHGYTDELRDRILTPLNLRDTYLPATGDTELREPHPTAYIELDGALTDVTRSEPSLAWSAGALVSTGADLNRFYSALSAGEVVPQQQLPEMMRDGTDMGNGDGIFYGLGLGYTELPCGTQFIGHHGNIDGYSTLAGATSDGRAATFSYTGSPNDDPDIRGILTHALCD